ncbi:MAG: trypsin-like peptidase domain-containing protein [Planctomycetes bacterium]|nr:trypsin-like peptidase domain-containing protein [Planctomycetota bacterium]
MGTRHLPGMTALLGAGILAAAAPLSRPSADAREEDLTHRIAALEASLERLRRRPSPADMARAILAPSVQVDAKAGAGGGTIIVSRLEDDDAYAGYVLTAFHVVAKAVPGSRKPRPVEITLYRTDGAPDQRVEGALVLWDEKKDIALLKLRTPHLLPTVRLPSRERLRQIGVFTPVYAVGCPLGHAPLPSKGEISTLRKEVQAERFWMMNAPTIFGNSGGGVFHAETLEFIGVSTMICTFDNPTATPVPHLGILLPLESIMDWLTAHDAGFLIDPDTR